MSGPIRTRARRWLVNLIWTIVGVGLYAVCINIFGGYPRWHSETLSWIAIIVIMALAALVWYRHERNDDEP
jgi:O-antigen/teichoic acid export membrane protein